MTDQLEEPCLNCQAKLSGPFCSQCGQAKEARLVPLKTWFFDFTESFLSFDSKLLATLVRVLFRPGQATLDFANGRRAPFSGPIQFYIVASALSIAIMSMFGIFSSGNPLLFPEGSNDGEFQNRVQFLFPFVNLFSPFLTAIVLLAFHPKKYFQLHLAFSLHLWSFLVILGTPLVFVPLTGLWPLLSFLILSSILIFYVFTAYQKIYPSPLIHRFLICATILFTLPLSTVVFFFVLIGLALVL